MKAVKYIYIIGVLLVVALVGCTGKGQDTAGSRSLDFWFVNRS